MFCDDEDHAWFRDPTFQRWGRDAVFACHCCGLRQIFRRSWRGWGWRNNGRIQVKVAG